MKKTFLRFRRLLKLLKREPHCLEYFLLPLIKQWGTRNVNYEIFIQLVFNVYKWNKPIFSVFFVVLITVTVYCDIIQIPVPNGAFTSSSADKINHSKLSLLTMCSPSGAAEGGWLLTDQRWSGWTAPSDMIKTWAYHSIFTHEIINGWQLHGDW